MIVPTCAKCDRPFPANNELASLPHGKRVAFDPELGRVWRICTKCGEWNLLGTEAARAAGGEITSRLVSIRPGAVTHDAIGDVDVITVAGSDAHQVVSSEGLKFRRSALTASRFLPAVPWIVIAIVAGPWFYRLIEGSEWQSRTQILSDALGGIAGYLLGDEVAGRRNGRAPRRGRAPTISAMIAGSALIALVAGEAWWGLVYFVVLGGLEFLLSTINSTVASIPVPDGRRLPLDHRSVAEVRIGYADVASRLIADQLPEDIVLFGDDVYPVVQSLMTAGLTVPTRGDVEQAWMILRTHHDVEGVVRALRELRPEDDGRHPFMALPSSWRFAIWFGIVEAGGTAEERIAMRDQIAAASEVAAIAESLDRRE